MIVFVVQDDYDPTGVDLGNEADKHVLFFSEDNSIDEVVDGVYDLYQEFGPIDCLAIVAHGNAGQVFIGSGLGVRYAPKFSRLRGTFSSHSRFHSRGIEIHGCAVASGTTIHPDWWAKALNIGESGHGTRGKGFGYDFMSLLAASAVSPVTGHIDMVWGFHIAHSFRGFPTMTVNPNGSAYFSENKT